MGRLFLTRGLLMALPFALWLAWSAWARRTGRPMGSTPWPWLFALGAALVGASLLATRLLTADNRGATYVPGEVGADGRVTPGRFEPKAR